MSKGVDLRLSHDAGSGLASRFRLKAALIRLPLPTFLILPALAFYLTILPYTINVPLLDDFGSILDFSNEFYSDPRVLQQADAFSDNAI